MEPKTNGGILYRLYRTRVGDPTTHDEVRGYWVFLVGGVTALTGVVTFAGIVALRYGPRELLRW
jgi:hypothetical protein